MFARSCSYYPGSTRAVNFGADSSDDEDALSEHEMIDLRAILFPDDNKSATPAGGPTHFSLSQHQIWALRKAQGPAPKLSTTQKEEEANVMDAKINKFLERLALARLKKRRRHGYDTDSSEEEVDDQNNINRDNNYNNNQANSTFQKILTKSSGTSTSNTDSNTFTNNKSSNNNMGTNTETTTTPIGVDSNNNNIQSKNATPQTTTATTKSITAQNNNNNNNWQHNNNDNDSDDDDNAHHHPEHTPNSAGSPRKQQYSWRCIRGKQTDGQLRGTYRTEDLVIQALTGVPISNAIHAHVPMHSASRAMRHTATFKMHKIVERLIHERTKYERHQVEEIKRQQMESTSAEPAETGGLSSTSTAGGGNLSRRVSRATLPNQLSTR